MRRDPPIVLVIMLISAGVAAAANVGWHKLDWVRESHPPKVSTVREDPAKTPTGLTAEQVLAHLQDGTACFVDAREEHEFVDVRLDVALHLPSSAVYEKIDDILSMIPVEKKLIVYCGGGECEASHIVAEVLREYEYNNVEIYEDGWEGIEASGIFNDFIVTGAEP